MKESYNRQDTDPQCTQGFFVGFTCIEQAVFLTLPTKWQRVASDTEHRGSFTEAFK